MHDLFTAIECHCACVALHSLHRSGVLSVLCVPKSVQSIAAEFDLDARRLRAVLQLICASTSVVHECENDIYVLAPNYRSYESLGFHLEKILDGYGTILEDVSGAIGTAELYRPRINEKSLAGAFAKVKTGGEQGIIDIIAGWGVRSLGDLGCGCAPLLLEFVRRDRGFWGWGIDRNPLMCLHAESRAMELGIADRITILCGNAMTIDRQMARNMISPVDALVGRSIMNELFGDGNQAAIDFLRSLRALFAEKLLFVVDYYGKLGSQAPDGKHYAHTHVHDLIQVLSGQGIPPSSRDGWNDVYAEAECEMVHCYEGESLQLQWFIHVVRL